MRSLFRRMELHPSRLLFRGTDVLEAVDWLRVAMDLSSVLGMFWFTEAWVLLRGSLEVVLRYLGLREAPQMVWAIVGLRPRWRHPYRIIQAIVAHECDWSCHLR